MVNKIASKILVVIFCVITFCGCKSDEIVEPKTTVGVFGASLSCFEGSEILRDEIAKLYDFHVDSNGYPGSTWAYAEFSVPFMIETKPIYDIYILWSPTNDIWFSKFGGDNETDRTTYTGGIIYSIELIRKRNKNAKIIVFTMLPQFSKSHTRFRAFVDAQIKICNKYNIDYVDLSVDTIFNETNYAKYYRDDKVHLNKYGYRNILDLQLYKFSKLCKNEY